jgi:hypothetical protein
MDGNGDGRDSSLHTGVTPLRPSGTQLLQEGSPKSLSGQGQSELPGGQGPSLKDIQTLLFENNKSLLQQVDQRLSSALHKRSRRPSSPLSDPMGSDDGQDIPSEVNFLMVDFPLFTVFYIGRLAVRSERGRRH